MRTNIEASRSQTGSSYERVDSHSIQTFYELQAPELADEARKVHAQGYVNEGFVAPEALTLDGYLPDDIDKARGDTVEFYLASNPVDSTNQATMRLISVPEGETVEFLPAYQLCKETVPKERLEFIESISPASIKEMGALARIAESSPMAAFELFRHALHKTEPGESWLYTVVATTHESLLTSFGSRVVHTLGDPIALNDSRVGQDVRLVPAITHTDTFIDDIRLGAEEADDPRIQKRLLRTFMFFSEGAPDRMMSDESITTREFITELMAQGVK